MFLRLGALWPLIVGLTLCFPSTAGAQSVARTLQELISAVAIGDTVHVTGRDGRRVKGAVSSLSGTSLVLLDQGVRREWFEVDLMEVRRTDSLTNGTWIGGVAGGVLGLFLGAGAAVSAGGLSGGYDGLVVLAAGVGAGLGAMAGRALDAGVPGPVIFRTSGSPKTVAITPIRTSLGLDLGVGIRF